LELSAETSEASRYSFICGRPVVLQWMRSATSRIVCVLEFVVVGYYVVFEDVVPYFALWCFPVLVVVG